MKKFSTLILFFFVLINGLLAQTENKKGQFYKHLPPDLDKETLIFLRHDSVDVPRKKPKGMTAAEFNRLWNHNSVIPTSNKQLRERLKEYPFKYIISSFDQLDSLSDAGYKYVYFFSGLKMVKTGTRMGTKVSTRSTPSGGIANTYHYSTQYIVIQNLQNEDRYYVDDFSETFVYYYKGIVGLLLKKVKKQFKENSKQRV